MLDEIYCSYELSKHSVVGRHVVAMGGSRDKYWSGQQERRAHDLVNRSLYHLREKWGDARLVISVGDATGVDAWVRRACDELALCYQVHHANWRDHGSFAGHERNGRVLIGADEFIAVMPPRPLRTAGTGNAILQAQRAGIRVHEWRGDWI
jgi:hypothetical protein